MIIKNFLEAEYKIKGCHEGEGLVKDVPIFTREDLKSKLRFVTYMEIPPKSSIGYHKHGENEEVYVILEGMGVMKGEGIEKKVTKGDVVLNQAFQSHGLTNDSEEELKILVFEGEF
jgi:mannose-6-phosphate isomerase-like protein (cupin superfamily)